MSAWWRTAVRQLDLQDDPHRLIALFKSMQTQKQNDPYLYASLIKACNKLSHHSEAKPVHARILRLSLDINANVSNSLLHFYMSSKKFIGYAHVLFDKMPQKNIVTINSMISGFIKEKELSLGIGLFKKLLEGGFAEGSVGMKPNHVTLVVLVSGCAQDGGSEVGNLLHCYCWKTGLDLVVEVGNVFIGFYVKCGHMKDGERVFRQMVERDLVSWNSIIAGYARRGKCRKGLALFREMRNMNIGYDRVSLVNLVLACANGEELAIGKMIHAYVIAGGEEVDVSLGTVLINMYSKCGLLEFARKIFDELPHENVASWNSIIQGYVEGGHCSEALEMFNLMRSQKVEPDEVTILGLILACRNSGELATGVVIHSYTESCDHLKGRIILQNALIDMYAKCGNMAQAKIVFDKIAKKDVISWTSIIVGHAINGEGEQALLAFQKMCAEKVQPNFVTFIGVLLACAHSGLVDLGQNLYDTMCREYGIEPKIEHYGCMVDMLARAGMLEEANKFAKKMPAEPNTAIWRMLVNACRVHGDVGQGLSLLSSFLEAKKPPSSENQVISSNIFAEAGRWEDVLHARNTMVAWEAPKMAGKSTIAE